MKAKTILFMALLASTLTACIRISFDDPYTYQKLKPAQRERVKLAGRPIVGMRILKS